MVEKAAKYYILFHYTIPFTILGIVFAIGIVVLLALAINAMPNIRKYKFLESNGFEKQVKTLANKYNNFKTIYQYSNPLLNITYSEDEVNSMSYAQLCNQIQSTMQHQKDCFSNAFVHIGDIIEDNRTGLWYVVIDEENSIHCLDGNGKNIEIPESDFEYYDKVAEARGLSLGSIQEQLRNHNSNV